MFSQPAGIAPAGRHSLFSCLGPENKRAAREFAAAGAVPQGGVTGANVRAHKWFAANLDLKLGGLLAPGMPLGIWLGSKVARSLPRTTLQGAVSLLLITAEC